jgi:thiamine-monophosphate kinase
MSETVPETVETLGELGLLQRLLRFCPADVVGDDAAVMALPAGQHLVVTTDVLVDGVHFSDRTTAPEDVGWRAIAANLSDLAAMGASPLGITVGLSLPGATPVAWIERLYQGIAACLQRWGGVVIGGDLCRSETISLAITALGSVEPQRALYRSRARAGQAILATGYHGLSRAGLELLLHPSQGAELEPAIRQRWIKAHQRPQPRLDVIAHLQALSAPQANGKVIAAMDTSDGLANAVMLIGQASGVGARLLAPQLPLDPTLVNWVGRARATEWCLYGGEDFELVLCLPPDLAQQLQLRLGGQSTIIGEMIADPAIELWDAATVPTTKTPLTLAQGFQHF